MTPQTLTNTQFCCNIKYIFGYNGTTYWIRNKLNEKTLFDISESDLYSVMEDISDLTMAQFDAYVDNKENDES